MNLRHPFDQLIAGKLRQLPAPDADASWQQMKRLLDDEDNRGGGAKPPPGNGGWWRIAIIAIVLLAGGWLFVEKSNQHENTLAKNNAASPARVADQQHASANTINSIVNKITAIDKNTTLPLAITNKRAANNDATDPSVTDKSVTAADGRNAEAALKPAKESKEIKTKAPATKAVNTTIAPNPATAANNSGSITTQAAAGVPFFASNKSRKAGKYVNGIYTNKETENKNNTNHNNRHTIVATVAPRRHSGKHAAALPGSNNNIVEDDNTVAAYKNNNKKAGYYEPVNQSPTTKEATWLEKLTDLEINSSLPSYSTLTVASDSLENTLDTRNLLSNETKKLVARAQRDKAAELEDKKEKKQLHLNLSNVFKPFSLHVDAEPWWAAGLAFNGNVTVHAQSRYNYNVNAKSGTLLDYIPSPYLQFHLNNYVYVQTELNLSIPQFTPQLLVYQQSSDISAQAAGMSQQKSIYIQKLYYFNWPFSLHYSPINNLYFSGGIQFSSFQSGLASIVEKQYTTTLGPDHASNTTGTLLKFKDDSIAAKIAPNEWRWQLGAEYYWNRFSVGVRYNRSFKNAINTTVSPLLPTTINRNESLLFFVKYNLFEGRNKNEVPKNQ